MLITSRYESTCSVCRRVIAVGDRIWWENKQASHAACSEGGKVIAAKVEASRSVREHGAPLLLPVPPGLEYLPFQKPAIALLLEHLAKGRGALLADEMGLGKQQPVDTKVLTPHGWKEIGTLQVGMEVIGSNGKPTRIKSVFPQGVKPNYRVTFSDGSSVEAGREHLWRVLYWRGGKYLAEMTLTTEELRTRPVKGKLSLAKVELYIPMLSGPVKFNEPDPGISLLDGYTLGALIANGSTVNGKSAVLTFCTDDTDTIRQRVNMGSMIVYGGASRGTVLGAIDPIRQLGLDVLSKYKFIPRCYQTASVQTRKDLLQGLMDGDGSCTKTRNRVVYHTTSEKLAEDVVGLVQGLGGIASIRTYDRSEEEKPVEYQVRVRLPSWVLPFSTPRKADQYNPQGHAHPTRTVKSVVYTRDVESVCIAVEAEDQLYVTEQCIVTHNTVEAIAVVSANTTLRSVLVVCRASLRTNWRREFERWCTRCPSAFGEGVEIEDSLTVGEHDPASAFHPDVTIVSYNQLSTLPAEVKWDLLIVDEAHYIKNPQSQRSKDLFAVADRCEKRLLLTGTPIPNTPVELWPLLQLCAPQAWDPPGLLYTKLPDGRREAVPVGAGKGAGFFDFARKYCGARKEWVSKTQEVWKFDGSSNAAELQEKLRTTCMVRRLKKDVLKDLPPKTRSIVVLPRHPSALKGKELAEQMTRADTLEEALDLLSGESVAFTEYSKERHAIGLAKVDIAVSHIQAALEPRDKKVVVFCHHNDVADALYGKLEHYNPALVTGLIEPKVRQREVDAFQGDRTCRLLIGTFGAAGEGYTLTASSHVVVVEEPLRPSDMLQAEDRCHRIGQTEALLCEHLVLDDSIDALIAKLLVDKLTVAEAAFDEEAEYGHADRPLDERNVSYDRAREEAYRSAGITRAECEEYLRKLKALAKIPGGVFNRFDRKISGSLAAQRFLSPKQGLLARRLVDKYGSKLEGSSS